MQIKMKIEYCECGKKLCGRSERCKSCSNRLRVGEKHKSFKQPESMKIKQSILKQSEKNVNWKGKDVKMVALHNCILCYRKKLITLVAINRFWNCFVL